MLLHRARHVVLDRRSAPVSRRAIARSSAGSRTCWMSTSAIAADQARSRSASIARQRMQRKIAGDARPERLGNGASDASAAITGSRSCRASACSSSVSANTCSLRKHCRASAQARDQRPVVPDRRAAGIRARSNANRRRGQKPLQLDIATLAVLPSGSAAGGRRHCGDAGRHRTISSAGSRRGQAVGRAPCRRLVVVLSLTSRAATGASSLVRPHGSDIARTSSARKSSASGGDRSHRHALHEQRLGLRRLGDRQVRAAACPSAWFGLPGRQERAREVVVGLDEIRLAGDRQLKASVRPARCRLAPAARCRGCCWLPAGPGLSASARW